MMKFQLINDGISADLRDDFWNDMLMVFGLTNTTDNAAGLPTLRQLFLPIFLE